MLKQLFTFSTVALFLSEAAHVDDNKLVIRDLDDFVTFANDVNSGVDYKGTTVYLDSDIDFSANTTDPINQFLGTFDGRGHKISNLVIESTSRYAGLFGYSTGITIRNLVIDESCTVTCTYESNESVHVGGIIGYCTGKDGSCTIENSLNMANVTFSGILSGSDNLYLGGVAGYLYSSSEDSATTVKNCANYGHVTYSGKSKYNVYIGGIAGYSQGASASSKVHIQNALNYGTIANDGMKANSLYIGGIVGRNYYSDLDNCVNDGSIVSSMSNYYAGSIVGYLAFSKLSHCFWNEGISHDICGYLSSLTSSITGSAKFDSSTFELNDIVSVGGYRGSSLIDALTATVEYSMLLGYSHWVLNTNEKTLSFMVNGTKSSLTLSSKLVLLPDLAGEGRVRFDGWYVDSAYIVPLTNFVINVTLGLYGKVEENNNYYTVSFDAAGGLPAPTTVTELFGTVISLPNALMKEECTFAHWRTDKGYTAPWNFTVPASNITLYAVWACTVLRTAEDLVDFSNVVNSGVHYKGTTVLVAADIAFNESFSREFEPINGFLGTFDGQGHTISNLVMRSSSRYTGLFGYSRGTTIRNVVIDASCSVVSSYKFYINDACAGGIIGFCETLYGPCIIENSVNMANITFDETADDVNYLFLYLGGIAGYLYSSSNSNTFAVRNWVNYGTISHSGESYNTIVGGLVGYAYGTSSVNKSYVQNSANYGTLAHNGTTENDLYIGGAAGYSKNTIFENCVSAAQILSSEQSANIGGIVGNAYYSTTEIAHSYWTSDTGCAESYGTGSPKLSESSLVRLDDATLAKLNECAANNSWSNWSTLHMNGGRINNISQESLFTLSKYFPDPEKEGNLFQGWFEDAALTKKYDPKATPTVIDAYAKFAPITYAVTFDFGNGTERHKAVIYGEPYGELPGSSNKAFVGWFTEKNGGGDLITEHTIVSIAKDHTLYALYKSGSDSDSSSSFSSMIVPSIILTTFSLILY